jgi:hypothetical protein
MTSVEPFSPRTRSKLPVWAITLTIVWFAVAIAVAILAVPIFEQPLGCGLQSAGCTPKYSVEWLPCIVTGALAATATLGVLVGSRSLVRLITEG